MATFITQAPESFQPSNTNSLPDIHTTWPLCGLYIAHHTLDCLPQLYPLPADCHSCVQYEMFVCAHYKYPTMYIYMALILSYIKPFWMMSQPTKLSFHLMQNYFLTTSAATNVCSRICEICQHYWNMGQGFTVQCIHGNVHSWKLHTHPQKTIL